MPLFGKRRESEERTREKPGLETWCTNAPSHWPAIPRQAVSPGAPEAMHQLTFIAAANKAFGGRGSGWSIDKIMTTRLDPQGLLDVTLEVTEAGKRALVLLYPKADAAAAGHYAGSVRFLEARGEPRPVYYAPSALPEAAPSNPLRPYDSTDLAPWKGDAPKEEFAMWWASEGDELPGNSPTVASIGRVYRALDGIGTYVFAAMMRQLRQVPPETGRVHLPKDGGDLLVEGPEGRLIMLRASQEKGIQFMFAVRGTPVTYRDAFWKVVADYAEQWKQGATERGVSLDPPQDRAALGWWTGMESSMALHTREGNPPERIGLWLPG